MEIQFHYQFDSTKWACIMTIDVENSTAIHEGGIPRLNLTATFKLPPLSWGQSQVKNLVILDLQGKLCRPDALQDIGGTLLPNTELPINIVSSAISYPINLSFAFSPAYIQLLEEQRATQPDHVMILGLQLWGTAAIIKPRETKENASRFLYDLSYDLIRFERVQTDHAPSTRIRFERSAWVDRLLPNLGYHHSLLVELPLVRTPPLPDMYQNAVHALENARCAFTQDDYQGALRYAREVLEHLGKSSSDGSKRLANFCKEYLEPLVGETKSTVIERSLNALRDVVNAASHTDPQKPFIADRAIAAYVIEALVNALRYIALAGR